MVSRPKNIGTAAESAVLKQITPYFRQAKRLVLAGAADRGDIGDTGDFIFEVKGGHTAERAEPGDIAAWMEEARVEARNSRVPFGVLVTKRKAVGHANARKWWVWLRIEDLAELTGGFYRSGRHVPVRLELGDFLELIADHGYTDAVGDAATTIIEDESRAS